jgi:hypothetical protein
MSESPGRLSRIFTYLNAQLPPLVMIPSGIATFLALHWTLQALGAEGPVAVTWRALLGAFTVTGFMFLLRVYDELKDADADRRLAAAGDPRYMDRPIVTGAVLEEDIVALRWVITALLVVFNAPLGLLPLGAFVLTYLIFWLSFKWFFWPKIQDNLLLALATHNPLTVVLQAYVFAVFVAEFSRGGPEWVLPVLCIGLWFPVAAWETSRKIRLPDMETDYQTYSQKFGGWRIAAVVPVVFVWISAGCLGAVTHYLGMPTAWFVVLGIGALVPTLGSLRLLLKPTPEATKLRPFVEAYAAASQVGLAIVVGIHRGVEWRVW